MYKPRRESYSDRPRSGGGSRYGGSSRPPRRDDRDRGGYGSRDREDRPSFDATCAECQSHCRVPFRPNGSKPVLCKPCFEKANGGSAPRRDFGEKRSYGDRPSSMVRPLERREAPVAAGVNPDIEARLRRIETKLDSIIEAINEPIEGEDEDEDEDEEIEEVIEEVKEVKKAKETKEAKKPAKEPKAAKAKKAPKKTPDIAFE